MSMNNTTFYGDCPIKKNIPHELSLKDKILLSVKNPYLILGWVFRRVSHLIKDDSIFAKLSYFINMHRTLNLKTPKSFNEKLQWLKLYNRRPEYTLYVDKYEVKGYIKKMLGEKYIIPTLGIYNSFDEIDFNKLPNQFVLKTTHDSGGIFICKDKSTMDIDKARNILTKSLKNDYYVSHREWPYKNVKHRIIAEKYMEDESGYELKDYKFFCFDGEPKIFFIATDRPHDTRFDFFDMDFHHLPFAQGHPWARHELKKPEKFEEMIDIARKLSKGMPHVRVDLYNINGQIYFGELTFFNMGANTPILPIEWDYKIGSWLNLPNKKTLSKDC